ncbi:hypothetical protein B0H14DRAFT_2613198 [Mycena olivaceomarginata]|nr:hypothetical protein B0H14DRAFT_2613198 [Mycena olivaceomarginata]
MDAKDDIVGTLAIKIGRVNGGVSFDAEKINLQRAAVAASGSSVDPEAYYAGHLEVSGMHSNWKFKTDEPLTAMGVRKCATNVTLQKEKGSGQVGEGCEMKGNQRKKGTFAHNDLDADGNTEAGPPVTRREACLVQGVNQEAEGRADYQQTDATSISTLTARMAAVSTKRGQLHRRWGLG